MRKLLTVVETYRTDTEEEAKELIAEVKEDSSCELTKYSNEYKEKKAKGEIIASGYLVKITKKYSELWDDVI